MELRDEDVHRCGHIEYLGQVARQVALSAPFRVLVPIFSTESGIYTALGTTTTTVSRSSLSAFT
ncbi:hypothetical protein B0T17DRAFT_542140 [Bombardia bombarda]|uniref:Uncharacterized protein n=1 Tax=Bombardia bombarda TaxID=252184 RepID=A0AA39U6K2_9PEZI|nr:hypothetical protein B0T17DRAFT_542140 [Bombardia bombarda]